MLKRRIRRSALLLACASLCSFDSRGWWSEGHEVEAKVAASTLPSEIPEFFRRSGDELAYLCNEPDRWRESGKAQALESFDVPSHWFAIERSPESLPPTRYEFIAFLYRTGGLADGKLTVKDFGMAPYAIAEGSEMLTETFRMWRAAGPGARKRQIEQAAIHAAGILCHYATDMAQPLHASVHIQGWKAGFPNPEGYSGGIIHRRFEEYADGAIHAGKVTAEGIAKRVGAPKAIEGWIEAAVGHARRTNSSVEKLYALDRAAPFGSGKESEDARALVEERLTAGSEMLRNLWYTAWVKSGRVKS
jgi:hypothetical protein